jgi:hypothetical protein
MFKLSFSVAYWFNVEVNKVMSMKLRVDSVNWRVFADRI